MIGIEEKGDLAGFGFMKASVLTRLVRDIS
jgi:hypothetical protein